MAEEVREIGVKTLRLTAVTALGILFGYSIIRFTQKNEPKEELEPKEEPKPLEAYPQHAPRILASNFPEPLKDPDELRRIDSFSLGPYSWHLV